MFYKFNLNYFLYILNSNLQLTCTCLRFLFLSNFIQLKNKKKYLQLSFIIHPKQKFQFKKINK